MVGKSKTEVSVRSEKNPSAGPVSSSPQTHGGLVTWGEFGSALLIILNDSSQGRITWSHWEQFPSGRVAVFHFEVPKTDSHYTIVTPIEQSLEGFQSSPSAATGGMVVVAGGSSTTKLARTTPGYHGSLWVDPATGTILRFSLIANLSGNIPFDRIGILVEYGSVRIADKIFICPVRSLALSSALQTVNTTLDGATTEWLNENLFTNYHIFATSSRILTADNAAATADNTNPNSPVEIQSSAIAEQAPQLFPTTTTSSTEQASSPIQSQLETSVSSATVPPDKALAQPQLPGVGDGAAKTNLSANGPSADSSAQAHSESKPMSVSQTSSIPEATQTSDSNVTIHVDVKALLVPAVVRDHKGRSVGDLVRSDFRVLDRGKPRAITGFSIEKSAQARDVSQPPELGSAGLTDTSQPAAASDRFTVFLFDDRHLNVSDLSFIQRAAIKMLDRPLVAGEYVDVLSFMGVNSGITRDRDKLRAAVMQLKMHPLHQHDDLECPNISAYTAHQIIDLRDMQVFQAAISQARSCSHLMLTGGEDVFKNMVLSAANRALNIGQEDARASLNGIETVVRAMAKLPGQRTLILVSPGFFTDSPGTEYFKSDILNQAAASNVIISALDARGMVVDTIGDDHVMSELATGTGGTFFHHSNDLTGGLDSLTVPPKYIYLLELSLNGVKPDGTYHGLKVKVDRRGLNVQARKGYVATKPENAK